MAAGGPVFASGWRATTSPEGAQHQAREADAQLVDCGLHVGVMHGQCRGFADGVIT
jgi:hypothetical protein